MHRSYVLWAGVQRCYPWYTGSDVMQQAGKVIHPSATVLTDALSDELIKSLIFIGLFCFSYFTLALTLRPFPNENNRVVVDVA